MSKYQYSPSDLAAVYRVINERRDMRHFSGGKVDYSVLLRIFAAAHAAPSVGFMQPWRFIRVTDRNIRQQLYHLVDAERAETAKALKEREDDFMQLKVEGILDCAELIVVTLSNDRDEFIFGRRTMPYMDLASASCAIQNMWLAARAEGLGMGWVSFFNPDDLKQLFNMPESTSPIAILCLGPVSEFYEKPMLSIENWEHRNLLEDHIMENGWDTQKSKPRKAP
jgi:5,6-dimethylbenzimidazole synthase